MSADKKKREPRVIALLEWVDKGYNNRRIHSGPLGRELKYMLDKGLLEMKRRDHWGCFMSDTKRTFLLLTKAGRDMLLQALYVRDPFCFKHRPRLPRVEKKARPRDRRVTQPEE